MADDPWAAFRDTGGEQQAAPPASTGADPWAAFREGEATAPASIAPAPPSFLQRLAQGSLVQQRVQDIWKASKEGFGDRPLGEVYSRESDNALVRTMPFPAKQAFEAYDLLTRTLNAGITGTGEVAAQTASEFGASQGMAERARHDVLNFGSWLMSEGGMRSVTRGEAPRAPLVDAGDGKLARIVTAADGSVKTDVVGEFPPTKGDFETSAKVLGGQVTEKNLQRAWDEDGIHPAEAAADAQRDAFVKHELTAPGKTFTLEETFDHDRILRGEKEGEIPLRAVGAEVTDPPMVPLSEQPAPPPGRLSSTLNSIGNTLFDIGRDAQMLTTPMVTGTRDSMAIAKDFANTLRRNRWEWSRIDDDIAKRFTPEQRKRMWDAADEESVLRQEGKTSEYMGLSTLTPEERAAVEEQHSAAQRAWARAYDVGLVKSEGLPAYTPRMVINATDPSGGNGGISLNGIGYNLRTGTANLKHRKYLTAEETEAAAKRHMGESAEIARDIRTLPLATARLEDAIAGRTLINSIKEYGKRAGDERVIEGAIPDGANAKEWFTMTEHPSFWTWRPEYERNPDGTIKLDGNRIKVKTDAEGNEQFERVPIYVHKDFEGPLRAVLTEKNGPIYSALMSLKGKTMSLIMNSPLIHNAVEWGRAMPAMPGKVATFKIYFEGYRVKNDPAQMREAIDNGLVPIGKRFFNQDITSLMEAPDLTPGRSTTSKILAFIPGLFEEGAGVAVKRAIDKAGDFWHNTLLWDRIADLQMGLYANFRDDLIAKGIDPQTSSRMAAHFANRYAGSLPQESMSNAARKISNFLMFSRTFTLGNIGVMKDAVTGLPKDLLAQIERDAGPLDPKAAGYAKALARRKAMTVIALDVGMLYIGNSLLQSASNVMLGDSSLEKEYHGYVQRLMEAMQKTKEHPLSLLQPFNFFQSLSATNENEPGRGERVLVGYAKDGTAIYARNPVGKIGEEFTGYMTGPLDMMRRKQGTIARPMFQLYANDKGFGRKIYDENADTPAKYLSNAVRIAEHFFAAQLPEGQIRAFADLVKGEGDAKVNALQAFGPIAGVTFSKGAPGGPAVGELYHARAQHDFAVDMELPDLRKQILRGDVEGAQQRMTELGVPTGLQRFYIRTTLDPSTRLRGRTLRDAYHYFTEEQRQRFENMQAPR